MKHLIAIVMIVLSGCSDKSKNVKTNSRLYDPRKSIDIDVEALYKEVKNSKNLNEVMSIMQNTSPYGDEYFGGLGNYDRIFLVSYEYQIVFSFDLNDKIIEPARVEKRGVWVIGKSNSWHPYDGSDIDSYW